MRLRSGLTDSRQNNRNPAGTSAQERNRKKDDNTVTNHANEQAMRNLNSKVCSLLLAGSLLTACASNQHLTQQMTETGTVIQQAEQVGAGDYAPLEIREANRKLALARQAFEEKEYDTAERLTEQARVDAELARIKTLSTQSQMAVTELREGIRILEEELNRTSR